MDLTCLFTESRSLVSDQSIYNCEVTHVKTIAPNGRVLNIHGAHIEGKSNTDVHTLKIFDQQLEHFPRYLCRFFPNLRSVSIIACGLKILTKNDLIGCDQIEKLMLNGNVISQLESDAFEHAKSLETISLFNNRLSSVDAQTFDKLKNLKYLNLKLNLKSFDWRFRSYLEPDRSILDDVRRKLSAENEEVIMERKANDGICGVLKFLEKIEGLPVAADRR